MFFCNILQFQYIYFIQFLYYLIFNSKKNLEMYTGINVSINIPID